MNSLYDFLSDTTLCEPDSSEIISTEPCDSGWTERVFGSKRKCYKRIGVYKVGEASQKCRDEEASLPIPRSDNEVSDLVATAEALKASAR